MPDKKSGYGISLSSENNMRAGTSPKLISSARESSSFPISDGAFNTRASIPSKKSKIALNMIKTSAHSYWASNAITLAIQPENKFRQVTVFGIWRVIAFAMDVLL